MNVHALVRAPAATLASGLTTAALGRPDVPLARRQHAAYVAALAAAGAIVHPLPADDRFPDGTFVEDVAVMTDRGAILTRPGAESRRGEVEAMRGPLSEHVAILGAIAPPGCVDGGDVCDVGSRTLIGLSERTNAEGASQLASLLALAGRRSAVLDVRRIPGLLHLKTGMAYLGEGRALAWDALASHPELRALEVVRVPAPELYAANAIRIGGSVLLPEGFPGTADAVRRAGLAVVPVPMSEFRKLDGGPSCLSLRWSST